MQTEELHVCDWFREFKDVDKSETQSSSKGCGLREKESQIRKHLVKHGRVYWVESSNVERSEHFIPGRT